MKKIVLVIDGHCIMCNSLAIWISKRDKENIIMITNFDSNYVKENSIVEYIKDKYKINPNRYPPNYMTHN